MVLPKQLHDVNDIRNSNDSNLESTEKELVKKTNEIPKL